MLEIIIIYQVMYFFHFIILSYATKPKALKIKMPFLPSNMNLCQHVKWECDLMIIS